MRGCLSRRCRDPVLTLRTKEGFFVHKRRQQIQSENFLLLKDIRLLIESARQQVSQFVNSALVLLNWQIGHRIGKEVLGDRRAVYGRRVILKLSKELADEYGKGYTLSGLSRMVAFAQEFPDRAIVATLSQQLSWSHFIEIIPLQDCLKRDFYAEMCRVERWSVRTLRMKIAGMFYERTALSKKPDVLIKQELKDLREKDRLSPDMVFQDPYHLDFLGLTGAYSEKDLELSILVRLERFLLEIGTDFSFLERQKRITVGGEDFYLDLLFYHRRLARLVAVELKLDKFKPPDKGQMEFYLRWLDKYERRPGEKQPLGLILCSGKNREQVSLLELDRGQVRVAEYWTVLPPRKVLERKLHEAVQLARNGAAESAI